MKFSRLIIIVVILLIFVSWFPKTAFWKKAKATHLQQKETTYSKGSVLNPKLKNKAAAAKSYIEKKGFNNNTCFLIDLSLTSGQKRFFIYDLKKDSVVNAGLVTHGNCYEYWLEEKRYSNKVGSGCTSPGRYKIGNPYTGKFGYSYKLYGLDSSNSNAYVRTVVLHSHSCVPDTEISEEICQSNGCPTVSPTFLEKLKVIINTSKKPLLLWIYE